MASSETSEIVGDAKIIRDFGDYAKTMAAAEFAETHGFGFLLLNAATTELKPSTAAGTVNLESRPGYLGGLPRLDFFVFPVRSAGGAPLVSVGRTEDNDIALDDQSISKFHAYFEPAEAGFSLQDAGSKNGTFVNDSPVPAKGAGDPIALDAGCRLRFGTLELTYLAAPEFWSLVRRLVP